jgi:hypothetical protein
MTTKLTLSVDPTVVASAKRYAAARGTSVSRLVQDYLAAVAAEPAAVAATPVLARLRGALEGADVEVHRARLVEKHG